MKSLSWGITEQTFNVQPAFNRLRTLPIYRKMKPRYRWALFDEADVAAAFDIADADIVQFLRFHGETQVFFNIVRRNMIAPHRAQNEIAIFPDHFRPAFDESAEPM